MPEAPSCYHQSFLSQCLNADILLSVWSFYFITFTVQDIILFQSELSFKWPYWPKNDVKKDISLIYLHSLCELLYLFIAIAG